MRSLLRRVAAAVLLIWLVITLTFVLLQAAPGDAADFLVPPDASPEAAAQMRTRLGLDRPVVVPYGRWLAGLLRRTWGRASHCASR